MKKVLALLMVIGILLGAIPSFSAFAEGVSFVTKDGKTYYYVDGKPSPDTLITEKDGKPVYIEKGVLNTTATAICKYNDEWRYIKNGKLSDDTTVCKYGDTYWYVNKGRVDFDADLKIKVGTVTYQVTGGIATVINDNFTGIKKVNGVLKYYKNGKLNSSDTVIVKYGSTLYYVRNGKLNSNVKTVCKYGSKLYRVEGGKVNLKATGLFYSEGKWYYIKKGVVDQKTKLLYKYKGHSYYIENGTVNFKKNGTFKYKGKSYKIKNGVAQIKGMKGTGLDKLVTVKPAIGAETFDGKVTGKSADDYTRPTNTYLPKGTIERYTGTQKLKVDSITNTYYRLKMGKRIYATTYENPGKKKVTVSSKTVGFVPDHNEMSVESVTETARTTDITFTNLYKAPFSLGLYPQKYKNAKIQDYRITAQTYTYVELKFYYATSFKGTVKFDAGNPVFKSAKVVKSGNNTLVRLYLKKKGNFYGYSADFNSKGDLVIKFLKPASGKKTEKTTQNPYGISLKNISVLIDVGHGGIDGGASGREPKVHPEKERNLYLAKMLKTELEKMGAKVYIDRTSDKAMTSSQRMEYLRKINPDFCIAIHHDSSTKSSINGCGVFYGAPISYKAAKSVYDATMKTGIYKDEKMNRLNWHYFYMTRMYNCPTVLTENGFISGTTDYKSINNKAKNLKKAQGLAQGIGNYFLNNK